MNTCSCGRSPVLVISNENGFRCLGCDITLIQGSYHWCEGLTRIAGYDPRVPGNLQCLHHPGHSADICELCYPR